MIRQKISQIIMKTNLGFPQLGNFLPQALNGVHPLLSFQLVVSLYVLHLLLQFDNLEDVSAYSFFSLSERKKEGPGFVASPEASITLIL